MVKLSFCFERYQYWLQRTDNELGQRNYFLDLFYVPKWLLLAKGSQSTTFMACLQPDNRGHLPLLIIVLSHIADYNDVRRSNIYNSERHLHWLVMILELPYNYLDWAVLHDAGTSWLAVSIANTWQFFRLCMCFIWLHCQRYHILMHTVPVNLSHKKYVILVNRVEIDGLTHWGREKIDAILQSTF